jgi:hypothetical protein
MKIHLLSPFMRHELLPTLISYLKDMDVIFHPIMTVEEGKSFAKDVPEWVQPLIDDIQAYAVAYEKINRFIDTQDIIDDDYYGFMGDDDMYEPGFFDQIKQETSDIIFYSLYRGDSIPECDPEKHPVFPIILRSISDIRVCNTGFCQYIMKGRILKQVRMRIDHKWGDGFFAETLREKFPDKIKIISDLFAFGNYFQPGRFVNADKFLKNTWRLPEMV